MKPRTSFLTPALPLCFLAAAALSGCGSDSSGGAAGLFGGGGSTAEGGTGGSATGGTAGGGTGGGPSTCTAGDFRCTSDVLERCADDGSAFATVATCPSGYCDAAGKQCDNCTAGETDCVTDARIRTCSSDGQVDTEENCPATAPFCGQPQGVSKCLECRVASECAPSTSECALSACSADGTCGTTAIAAGAPCGAAGAGGTCDGSGTCRYCTPGEGRCTGLVPELCDANGQWIAGTACSGATALCLQGACVQCKTSTDCPASSNDCVSPACGANNQCGYSPKVANTACGGGAGKCDGAGQCNVCTPGTAICNGNVPYLCGNNGQYAAQPACSGATPNCDPATGTCVECAAASQCTPSSNTCLNAVCTSNACGFAPKPQGTVCTGGTCSVNGVCQACTPGLKVCSGNGVLTCNNGGQYEPIANCTAPTAYCDATTTSCVACTSASQCTTPANTCLQATCSGNACGIANKTDGTACTANGEAGTCSAGNCRLCTTGATRCKAGVPDRVQTCDANGVWQDGAVCSGGTPMCSLGACVGSLSCNGLAANCGPTSNESCCASALVPAGAYLMGRSTAGTDAYAGGGMSEVPEHTATIAGFRLDLYEVTVGRFRKFVEAYPGSKPLVGAGANPSVAGTGWNAGWALAADQATLKTGVNCNATNQTWRDTAGTTETLGMSCVNWYEAFAFCAWDGGWLPTEAEWEKASAGGDENRLYPWGAAAPTASLAVYNGAAILAVGSKPLGKGRWGQYDLAGGMWEWVFDFYDGAWYSGAGGTCTNCANVTIASSRVLRGGAWYDVTELLRAAYRYNYYYPPTNRGNNVGFRCARSAP